MCRPMMRQTLWAVLISAVHSMELCLPAARQGAAAISWRASVLVVGGSRAPKCGPKNITHLDDILLGPPWKTFARMGTKNARTHHAAFWFDGCRLYGNIIQCILCGLGWLLGFYSLSRAVSWYGSGLVDEARIYSLVLG